MSRQVAVSEAPAQPAEDSTSEPLDADGRPVRGARGLRWLDRWMARVERALDAGVGGEPLVEAGAAADLMLLVATLSGVALLLWYVPSQQQAHGSVVAMGGRTLAGFVRSVHRYSSDMAMAFVLWHALRTLGQRRVTGTRWLAWVSGVLMLGITWSIGWTGYWLLWDQRGRRVAEATARLVDAFGLATEPLQRSFLTSGDLRGLLFFLVFFFHMIVPLAIGLGLWFHLARLRRSRFWPTKATTRWLLAVLALVSIAWPADVGPAARLDRVAGSAPLDLWYLGLLPWTERLAEGVFLAAAALAGASLFSLPWLLRKRRAEQPAAEVEESRCFACETCIEDCPYGAIEQAERTDGRDFPWTAKVDPSRCVACGICVGSCSSGGVELPWWPQRQVLERISRWAEAQRDGAPLRVAFLCEEALGGRVQVDLETRRSEQLRVPEGWRLLPVPCAGWVRAGLLSRAFSRGMARALVVSCHETQCRFREGAHWEALRLAGERKPWPKRSQRERIERLAIAPGDLGALHRALGAEAARASTAEPKGRGTAGGWLRAAALGVAALAFFGVTGAAPVDPPRSEQPELVVTVRLAGELRQRCRQLSPEEIAAQPPHMRRTEECSRGRAAVRLRVSLDGATLREEELQPAGLWGDGPAMALLRFRPHAGEHRLQVWLDPTGAAPPAWPLRFERTLRFGEGHRVVLAYDPEHGFRLVGEQRTGGTSRGGS